MRGLTETQGASEHLQERRLLPPQALMGFAPGEFAGKVAESNTPFFHTQLKPVASYDRAFRPQRLQALPCLRQEEAIAVDVHYRRIWAEAQGVLAQMNGG